MAGFAVTWAAAVNDLMLKPLFGRFDIDAYYNRHYGFRLLQGATQSSFPSGHAAVLMSLLSVAWIAYPRFRPVYGAIAALLLPCLMAAGWHFLSDVVAGAFVGMTAGLMTVTLWGNLWRHPISPPIAF
jgi:membrane-associated phospholipid phosphatase